MEGLKLINAEFDIEFANKTYKVRKASIEQVILFQTRMMSLADQKDSSLDIKAAAYCIFLTIQGSDKSITEDWVLQNAPGDLDPYDIFVQLGFMNRQKVDLMRGLIRNASAQKTPAGQTGESSLAL